MKNLKISLFSLSLPVIALLFPSCKGEEIKIEPEEAITLACAYPGALVLTDHNPNGVDYLVTDCDVEITGQLTIEPGVTIQFSGNRGIRIMDNGSVSAAGTAALPIAFTGTSATTPCWKGISVESNHPNNRLEHCRIQAAGFGDDYFVVSRSGSSYSTDAAVSVYGRLAMTNCVVSNSGGHGVAADAEATLTGFGSNTISGSAGFAVYLSARVAGQPDLASCTFTGNTTNKVGLYGYTSNGEWPGTHTLKALPVPYYVVEDLTITEGAVDLEAGTILEFAADRALYVRYGARFSCNGTAAKHVTIRGEQAVKGWWAGILVNTNNVGNVLSFTDLSDGGSRETGFIVRRATISVGDYETARLTLNSCTVTNYQGECQAAFNLSFGELTNNSAAITSVCGVE